MQSRQNPRTQSDINKVQNFKFIGNIKNLNYNCKKPRVKKNASRRAIVPLILFFVTLCT